VIPDGMPLVIFVGRIFLVLATISTTWFWLYYTWLAPWYKHGLGWVTMFRAMALAVVLTVKTILTFLTDNIPAIVIMWVNVSVVATIAITSAAQIYIMWSLRRKIRGGTHDGSVEQGL
jgi:hypothetical protein